MDAERELEARLNWLRAAVLGANDGVVSVAGVVMGVAAAGSLGRRNCGSGGWSNLNGWW